MALGGHGLLDIRLLVNLALNSTAWGRFCPQIREQMSGPDLHVFTLSTLKFLALCCLICGFAISQWVKYFYFTKYSSFEGQMD